MEGIERGRYESMLLGGYGYRLPPRGSHGIADSGRQV